MLQSFMAMIIVNATLGCNWIYLSFGPSIGGIGNLSLLVLPRCWYKQPGLPPTVPLSIIRFISSKIRNNHTRINNWSFC
jgi:hypothetical protein